MPITQYTGKTLLQDDAILNIEKEADLIVKNKDVAAAWQSSKHLKEQISSLPQPEIAPVIEKYRRITSKLKALALPLLSQEDVEHLLKNNLEFLDTQSEAFLAQGLSAWISSQPEEKQQSLKEKLSSIVDKDSAFAPKILEVLRIRRAPEDKEGFLNKEESSDLKKSAQKAEEIGAFSQNDQLAESVARQIFSLSPAQSNEELFVNRAKALVKSRLRDVRTKLEISGYLSRPFQSGGLGFTGENLDHALELVENAHSRIHSSTRHSGGSVPATDRISVDDVDSIASVNTPRSRMTRKDEQKTAPKPVLKPKPLAPKPEPVSIPKPKPKIEAKPEQKIIPKPIPKPPTPVQAPRKQVPTTSGPPAIASRASEALRAGKVRVDDIKTSLHQSNQARPAVQAKGLSDELNTITLADFRTSSGAVLEKISVLERESIEHKMSGIRNFRASPLYKQYLAIGDASLSGEKKLSEVLADAAVNPDKMTEDEFFAITDLNSKLK